MGVISCPDSPHNSMRTPQYYNESHPNPDPPQMNLLSPPPPPVPRGIRRQGAPQRLPPSSSPLLPIGSSPFTDPTEQEFADDPFNDSNNTQLFCAAKLPGDMQLFPEPEDFITNDYPLTSTTLRQKGQRSRRKQTNAVNKST